VGLFVIYSALSVSVLTWIFSGAAVGRQAVWAWVALSAIMICDLYRADVPWIRYYNYKDKMSMNPAVEKLRQKPWSTGLYRGFHPWDRTTWVDRMAISAASVIGGWRTIIRSTTFNRWKLIKPAHARAGQQLPGQFRRPRQLGSDARHALVAIDQHPLHFCQRRIGARA